MKPTLARGKVKITQSKNVCSRRPESDIEKRGLREKQDQLNRRLAWHRGNWAKIVRDPNALPGGTDPRATVLLAPEMYYYGIDIIPIGFPTNTYPQDLQNYRDIIYAFSRGFGPQLFEEIHFSDPFPTGAPYWSNFFYQITPVNGRFNVGVTASNVSGTCFGQTGGYQPGSNMSLLDCTDAESVSHEIGHAIMDDGVLAKRPPFFFQYSPVGLGHLIDTVTWLKQLFGNLKLDSGNDIDGVKIGFVSTYAEMNQKEDFAETYAYYVHYPELVWEKVVRQRNSNSYTLEAKMEFISYLYKGISFKSGGQVAGWSGMS